MDQPNVTEAGERIEIAALVPLALLESMRAHDRPREAFHEENITTGLPQRLGLTGVVESQIERYTAERKRSARVRQEEVADLIRLVLRRPDGEAILREAGRRVAQEEIGSDSPVRRLLRRILPHALARAAAGRRIRRLVRRLTGNARFAFESGDPPTVRLAECFTAELNSAGLACRLYGGMFEESIYIYTNSRPVVSHVNCIARGADGCEWKLEPPDSLGEASEAPDTAP